MNYRVAICALLLSRLVAETSLESELIAKEVQAIEKNKSLMVQIYKYSLVKEFAVNDQMASLLRVDIMQRRMLTLNDFTDDILNEEKLTPDERRDYVAALQEYGVLTKEVLYKVRADIIACRDDGRASRFEDPAVAYVDNQRRYATPKECSIMRNMLVSASAHVDAGEMYEAAKVLTWDWEDIIAKRQPTGMLGDALIDHEIFTATTPFVFKEMLQVVDRQAKGSVIYDNTFFVYKGSHDGQLWRQFGFRRINGGTISFDWTKLAINKKMMNEHIKKHNVDEDAIKSAVVQRVLSARTR